MAIKTISQFDAATPASNDKILFEQNGEGKSANIGDLTNAQIYQTRLDFTVVVTANTLTTTTIDYNSFGIDHYKILAWQLTWSNSVSDIPTVIIQYLDDRRLKSVVHKWEVAQNVNFKISLLMRYLKNERFIFCKDR